jgi:hypothetical protein
MRIDGADRGGGFAAILERLRPHEKRPACARRAFRFPGGPHDRSPRAASPAICAARLFTARRVLLQLPHHAIHPLSLLSDLLRLALTATYPHVRTRRTQQTVAVPSAQQAA